jgi:hypothetical protein
LVQIGRNTFMDKLHEVIAKVQEAAKHPVTAVHEEALVGRFKLADHGAVVGAVAEAVNSVPQATASTRRTGPTSRRSEAGAGKP